MPRAKSLRTLQELPTVKGFRPLWMRTNYRRAITLNLEEYEVIRLIDYENLIQELAWTTVQNYREIRGEGYSFDPGWGDRYMDKVIDNRWENLLAA